jgi:hypothetical protein
LGVDDVFNVERLLVLLPHKDDGVVFINDHPVGDEAVLVSVKANYPAALDESFGHGYLLLIQVLPSDVVSSHGQMRCVRLMVSLTGVTGRGIRSRCSSHPKNVVSLFGKISASITPTLQKKHCKKNAASRVTAFA